MNIEEYKEKFRFDLVGSWVSSTGSFMMMSYSYVFHGNGMLKIHMRSALDGVEALDYKWRRSSEFSIEIQGSEDPDEVENDEWEKINYSFCESESDVGKSIVLIQVPNSEDCKFHYSPFALEYVGAPQ